MNTTAYKMLGTSDEVSTCDCCGRANLKYTVALDVLDDEGNSTGEPVYFGSTCAAQALGRGKTAKAGREVFAEAEKVGSASRVEALVAYARANMPACKAEDLVEVSARNNTLVTLYTYLANGLTVGCNDKDGRDTDAARKAASVKSYPAAYIHLVAPLFKADYMERAEAVRRFLA